jgi:hypothetical protein
VQPLTALELVGILHRNVSHCSTSDDRGPGLTLTLKLQRTRLGTEDGKSGSEVFPLVE